MTMKKSSVFEETYQKYRAKIGTIDYLSKAEALGVERDSDDLLIPLYDTLYRFGAKGILPPAGVKLTVAVQVMICKYILTCPDTLPECDTTLVTYREFKDASPLISYFTNNTNKTLESAFSGNLARLRDKAREIGGKIVDSDTYDLSLLFFAFPRIPVVINFNDRDDLFPAACSVLYERSAANFLDMECLAMTGTLLTGKLLDH